MRERLAQIAPEELAWVDRRLASAAYARGLAAYDRRDWDGAAAAFGRAAELVPEWTEMRFRLAMSHVRAGRTAEARPHLELVANAADGGDFPEACYELGDFYLRRGGEMDRHIARTWFERFVKAMEQRGEGEDERVQRARRILRDLVPG